MSDVLHTIVKPRSRSATGEELELFQRTCERTGLDPLARQIYASFRRDRNGIEHMSIQATIDGLRAIAERSESYLGAAPTQWCGPNGELLEVWLKPEPPLAARVTVRRLVQGHVAETTAVAHWAEYAPDTSAPAGRMWKQMPALMLAKVAEALALRRAFPLQLSGIYTTEEMAQAEPSTETPAAGAPDFSTQLKAAAKGLKWGDIKLAYKVAGLTPPDYAKQAFLDLDAEQAEALEGALLNAKLAAETDVPYDTRELVSSPETGDTDLPWDSDRSDDAPTEVHRSTSSPIQGGDGTDAVPAAEEAEPIVYDFSNVKEDA